MIMSALALASALTLAPATDAGKECAHDRSAMLALNLPAFDQDPAGGWRSLEARGCVVEAADAIRDWRAAHVSMGPADTLLAWHEGQLRADAGQYAAAVTLLEAGRHPAADDAKWGWNLYVDGTVAFLRGDRRGLDVARARLAALPRPPELKDAVGADGRPRAVRWPMNMGVLDNLLRCWGRSYKVAYRCPAP